MIQVMNLRTCKPEFEYDVRIDRGTALGNPFYMNGEAMRDEVCDKYEEMPKSEAWHKEIDRLLNLYALHGKLRLFCWCAPKRCHGMYIKHVLLGMTDVPRET